MYNLEGVVFDNSPCTMLLTASGMCSSEYWSWEHNKVSSTKRHRKKFKITVFIQTKLNVLSQAVYM